MEKHQLVKYKTMNNQGKRDEQIEDSEGIIAFALVGLVISILAVIIQNLIS